MGLLLDCENRWIVCSSNYGSSHFTFPPNCIIFVKISKNIQMLEKCGLMKPRTPQFRLLFENLIVDPATAKHGTISPADQCNKLEHLNIATCMVLEYSFPLKSLFKISILKKQSRKGGGSKLTKILVRWWRCHRLRQKEETFD